MLTNSPLILRREVTKLSLAYGIIALAGIGFLVVLFQRFSGRLAGMAGSVPGV